MKGVGLIYSTKKLANSWKPGNGGEDNICLASWQCFPASFGGYYVGGNTVFDMNQQTQICCQNGG